MIQNPNNATRILIADDDPMTHRLLKDFLENLGYQVTSVMDANAAIVEIQKGHYDLLISDVIMPGMDGIELTRLIKNTDRYRNLPIILLSARSSTCAKVEAFESLANDYVTKPFDFDELAARIKTQLRLKHLQEEMEYKNILLNKRNSELESHLDIAKRIQRQLLPLNTREIYGVEISSFYRPIDKVGGDIFDLIPLENGRFGIFIGDISGHGVPSAFLNIVLRMMLRSIVKEDEPQPSKILERINSEIMPYMPEEDFITASYGIIDTNHRVSYFASAGHPMGIIIRAKDGRIELINIRGPCIGIMDDITYETKIVRLFPGDRFIFYTDGLSELRNSKGEMLGTKGLCEIVGRCTGHHDPDKVVSSIVSEIDKFSGNIGYEDDLTILCLEIGNSFYYSWFTKYIDIQSALGMLIKPLITMHATGTKDIKKVKVALYEAISNAIEHGNLEIPASLKGCDLDDRIFERLKEERMNNTAYARRKITARYLIHDNKITYYIKDEGPGFDPKDVGDPTSQENITRCYGRGIALMRMCMDEVSFSDKGNEVRLVKNFPPP